MNFFTTFVSVALLIVSSINAMTISSPTNGASVLRGSAFSLLVNTVGSESATQVSVLFSSSFGTFTGSYAVGTTYSVILPFNMAGITTITATATEGTGATAISSINLLTYNPYIPCYNPCYNPCVRPCEPRRPSCHIPRTSCNIPRPRSSCRIRDENDASSVEEANFEQNIDDSKEITFELNTEQLEQSHVQEAIQA